MFVRTHPRTRRAGFTLIEMMIAIIVLLVAVMATFTSQLRARELMQTSRETNIAMSDLQSAMERMLLRSADELPVAGSLYEDDTAIAAYDGLHLPNEQILVDYPGYVLGGPVPDPLPIVLRLNWTDSRGRPRFLSLRSMTTR
jgi:prepilin-type N-terminal cleavage/methylation domain-containing protein